GQAPPPIRPREHMGRPGPAAGDGDLGALCPGGSGRIPDMTPGASSPLSPAQRDLLLESSSSPGAAPHVIGTSIELPADLDPARWQAAAQAVFQTEPGMRMRLAWSEGEPRQVLDREARLVRAVVNLADEPEADVGDWVSRQLSAR